MTILDAFWEARKRADAQIWDPLGGMRGSRGGIREVSDKGFGQGSGKEGKDLASSRRICCPGSSTPSPGGAADRFAHSAEPLYLGC